MASNKNFTQKYFRWIPAEFEREAISQNINSQIQLVNIKPINVNINLTRF